MWSQLAKCLHDETHLCSRRAALLAMLCSPGVPPKADNSFVLWLLTLSISWSSFIVFCSTRTMPPSLKLQNNSHYAGYYKIKCQLWLWVHILDAISYLWVHNLLLGQTRSELRVLHFWANNSGQVMRTPMEFQAMLDAYPLVITGKYLLLVYNYPVTKLKCAFQSYNL